MKRPKYHNRKIEKDGIKFDSVREYNRWYELQLLERAGQIENLQRQVEYSLIPAQYDYVMDKGKKKRVCVERACTYIADFVYRENGQTVVEDSKGHKTKDYIIKRKLMLYKHGIRIKES